MFQSHNLTVKKLIQSEAVPREEASQSPSIKQEEKNSPSLENYRVFVGGLASATTEERL